jgi:hypothetical protein
VEHSLNIMNETEEDSEELLAKIEKEMTKVGNLDSPEFRKLKRDIETRVRSPRKKKINLNYILNLKT